MRLWRLSKTLREDKCKLFKNQTCQPWKQSHSRHIQVSTTFLPRHFREVFGLKYMPCWWTKLCKPWCSRERKEFQLFWCGYLFFARIIYCPKKGLKFCEKEFANFHPPDIIEFNVQYEKHCKRFSSSKILIDINQSKIQRALQSW